MLNSRILIAAVPLLVLSSPVLASTEEEQPERDYLPGVIVVNGSKNTYRLHDGSTATKTPTPIIDVPQAVTAITSDQIEDQNLRSLNDALRFVPGVSIGAGEGHRDEVFLRGQRTTADFFIDGLRDDAQYYRPLYNVERVEVLKGPNALIFGRGAGGGAINRVAKLARLGETRADAGASIDNFGAFDLAADVAIPASEAAAVRLNAFYEEFGSNRDVFEGRFFGISPTATVQLSERTRLIASYTYDDDRRITDRGLPAFANRPLRGWYDTFFGDPRYNTSFLRAHIGRARLEHEFSGRLSVNASLRYADYAKFYGNIVPGAARDTSGDGVADAVQLSGYDAGSDRRNLIGQANLVWTGDTGPIGHTLLLGAEFARQDTDATRDQVFFGSAATVTVPLARRIAVPAFTTAPQRASRSELDVVSFYVQDQIAITRWLDVVAGARFDRFSLDSLDLLTGFTAKRTDQQVSPRFGVVVKPGDNLSVYASYTESFLPSAGDQFTALSGTTVLLEPEEFENLEAGVKWAPRPDLLATAAVFRLDRSNTPAVNDQGLTVLTGASRVSGVELSLAGSFTDRLHLNVGYTYLDGEIRSDIGGAVAGTEPLQLPEHQIGAWGRYDFNNRLGIGLGIVHQSDQFASYTNTVVLPAWTRVDGAAYYTASERLTVQLNIENLLDAEYFPGAHGDNNIQPGRPFSARLGVRFSY